MCRSNCYILKEFAAAALIACNLRSEGLRRSVSVITFSLFRSQDRNLNCLNNLLTYSLTHNYTIRGAILFGDGAHYLP